MATYKSALGETTAADLRLLKLDVYGSQRLGVLCVDQKLADLPEPGAPIKTMEKGRKHFELVNLPMAIGIGNVLSVISDRLFSTQGTTLGKVARYTADLVSSSDYLPFGMQMPGRKVDSGKYRYGFNGKEKETGITGSESHYDFGARIYDGRIGRWLAVDPLEKKYAYLTSYHFTSNNPICFVDYDGKDFTYEIIEGENGEKTIIIKMTIYAVSNKAREQSISGAAIWNYTKFSSQGYNVKFDIQVLEPPIISEEEVKKRAEESKVKIYTRRGKRKKAYYVLEREIQDEQMLLAAKEAYKSGNIGSNNVYAGAMDFEDLKTDPKNATTPGTYELGRSNGKAIVTDILTESVNSSSPGVTSYGTSTITEEVDQGSKPWLVAHEIGHNLGFPDYTPYGYKSGGIMDYETHINGQISQFEIDDLVNQILRFEDVLNSTPEGNKNQSASSHFKSFDKSEDKYKYSKATFKNKNQITDEK